MGGSSLKKKKTQKSHKEILKCRHKIKSQYHNSLNVSIVQQCSMQPLYAGHDVYLYAMAVLGFFFFFNWYNRTCLLS